MGTVNYANPNTDTSVKIFDRLFGTGEAAENFTVTLFRVAENSNTPVMTLLQQIQGQTGPELTLTLAYYINGTRSNSTLLGLNVATQPNYYVAHNIRN